MQHKSDLIRIKRKTIIYFIVMVIALATVTPVLADFLGPNRTVTETTSACKVILYECKYVPAKDEWRYKKVDDWSCSNESKPWQAYSSQPSGCSAGSGDQYWDREEAQQEATNTYPPATIGSSLQNCTLQNGWCVTAAKISLSGNEPVSGYSIIAIEGSRNAQNFACAGANCIVSLNEGNNSFTYWALSSWGDSSNMGTFTAKVDSQMPSITGAFTGISGANNWYVSPVSFNGSATDATSGLASFTCTLDGVALPSCTTITVNTEGMHSLVLTARDNAGNTRNTSQNASIDTQNPILNSNLSGTLGSNTWYTAATFNATASDPMPGSGLSSFEYNLDNISWISFPASGVLDLPDGKHSVDIRTLDNAGHTVSASKSFWLDTVAPNVTYDSLGTLGLNNWHISNINITASANDATSGLDIFEYSLDNSAWTSYTGPLTLTEGTHNLSFWAQDSAGLVTQVDNTYYVDTHAPQIAGSLNGVHGTNGWYISDVTLSASASDPMPGSNLDGFSYVLNGAAETPYTNALNLSDGLHTIQLNARDKAGLSYSTEQTIKVDTIRPSLNLQTTLPEWLKESITLNGSASDAGSGLSKVEISTNGKQTWQAMTSTTSWSYLWNTMDSSNGIYDVHVRGIDIAGLTTEQAFSVRVDNIAPKISLPDSWYQWDTITLDVWDNHSGLSEVRVEISDPEGRWPTRKIDLDPENFPLDFKWDRRFKDGTIAPLGTYDMKVIAFDNLGNQARQSASINILLGILPAGPTATPQPYSRFETIQTPSYTATPGSYQATTQTPIVSVFGSTPEPFTQTAQISETIPTSRVAPTQTNVLDWLQSIFSPNSNSATIVTEIVSPEESKNTPQHSGVDGSVLWGSSAAAMLGAATAYALEERRKQQEEKARQEALEAQKEERRKKIRQRKMEKLEVKWAQERSLEEERLAQQVQIQNIHMETKMMLMEAQEEAAWMASQATIRNREDAKKAEELQAGLAAYYAGTRQGEKEAADTPSNWWDKTKSFVQDNIFQTLNAFIQQPSVQTAVEKTKQFISNESAWINENIYQPHIKPFAEKTKQFVINESAWINENIYQPHVKPFVEKTKQFVINESAWINENIYQPHVKPFAEKTKQFVINESAWINEKIYQPYIKPVVNTINTNIYQPYIKPIVNVIEEKVYKPYIKPVVDNVTVWSENSWDKYGEWVHGSLDAAGLIPGFGEIADGLNGLIYLGEGRYVEASISALAMIPILGDLGKAGKLGLAIGKEVLEEAAEKIVKETTEELVEKIVKENLGEVAEKVFKETGEELAEKTAKEVLEEVSEKTSKVVVETGTKEVSDEVATKVVKDTVVAVPPISTKEFPKTIADETFEETLEQVNEEAAQFVSSLTEKYSEEALHVIQTYGDDGVVLLQQYGEDVVDFVKWAEKLGVNPIDVLDNPPLPGQTLEGWLLKIDDLNSPVNIRSNLKLSISEIADLLIQSIHRSESNEFALGFFDPNKVAGYLELAKTRGTAYLEMAESLYNQIGFKDGDFWKINRAAIQYGLDQRKTFVLSTPMKTILENPGKYTYAEIQMILHPGNNYIHVHKDGYDMMIPAESLMP